MGQPNVGANDPSVDDGVPLESVAFIAAFAVSFIVTGIEHDELEAEYYRVKRGEPSDPVFGVWLPVSLLAMWGLTGLLVLILRSRGARTKWYGRWIIWTPPLLFFILWLVVIRPYP